MALSIVSYGEMAFILFNDRATFAALHLKVKVYKVLFKKNGQRLVAQISIPQVNFENSLSCYATMFSDITVVRAARVCDVIKS